MKTNNMKTQLVVNVKIANKIDSGSWLNDPEFEWFRKGYEKASVSNRAIPALSKCTPEELYFAVAIITEK